MGTSTKLPGPRGEPWALTRGQMTRWAGVVSASRPSPEDALPADLDSAERLAERYRRALADTLRDDPDMSGLRPAALRVGGQLVSVLADLLDGESALFTDMAGSTAQEREDEFVARFVSTVGGDGGLVGDSVARRAARRTAEKLLDDCPAAEAALRTREGTVRLDGDLFCSLYRFFFGEFVGEFISTVIVESLPLTVPLTLPLDPTGLVASAVTRQVVESLPDPCAEATGRDPRRGLLAETAGELVNDMVEHALGLREASP
ncbi:hypothetical protein [Micromonospora sp. KLBMP9576]|uniref:hypothetical protein n=1 Tax=Micromonospora sp. KLBMP9576 TaxID=3424769 RepID=UPI003D92C4F7